MSNGKSFLLSSCWATSQNLNLFTDMAGSLGYAAIFGIHWCFGEWPSAWKQFNIAILEFFPIFLAIEIWGLLMHDKCIVFFSDNQAVVDIINRQTSKNRSVMQCNRTRFLPSELIIYNVIVPCGVLLRVPCLAFLMVLQLKLAILHSNFGEP